VEQTLAFQPFFFRKKYPNAKIIAIEPDKENISQMNLNLKGYDNWFPLYGGVWNKTSFLMVNDIPGTSSWNFTCSEIENYNEGCINGFSIEDILFKYEINEIDLLKIDIEGAEYELFSSNYEKWLPKTKCIYVELHDWFRKDCSRSFFTALLNYDFSIYTKGEIIICLRNNL